MLLQNVIIILLWQKQKGEVSKVLREAVPSVLLIVIIIGGILTGLFTAIEASAIAVAYHY